MKKYLYITLALFVVSCVYAITPLENAVFDSNMQLTNYNCSYDTANNAYVFNGKNSNLSNTNSGLYNLTTAFTIAAWINPLNYPTTYPRIAGKEKSNTASPYVLTIYNTKDICMAMNRGASETYYCTTTHPLSLAVWQHVMASWDNSRVVIWLNNVLVFNGSVSGGSLNNSIAGTKFLIGNSDVNNRQFNGSIKDLRIWTRALDGAERLAVFNNQTVNTTGMIAWYPFENSTCKNYPSYETSWNINCADNCYINNIDVTGGRTVSITGTGTTKIGTIYNWKKFMWEKATCMVQFLPGARIG